MLRPATAVPIRPAAPLSEAAIGDLLERAGFKGIQVPHGWRATFSTIMNGRRRGDQAVIDLMLAHVPKGKVEKAYNRQPHMELRREIAQEWADLLLNDLPRASELIDLPRRSPPSGA